MNTDDTQFVPPTVTGSDGQEPAVTGSDRRDPTNAPTRSEAHTLTTREVMKMFEDSGVPRNQRTIERYCKGGDLDCFPDSLEKRYYITQTSVETLIGQLKEIASRHEKISVNAEVPPRPTPSDTDRPTATDDHTERSVKHEATEKQEDPHRGDEVKRLAALEARIKELENEKFNLEIDKRAKEQVLGMMREQQFPPCPKDPIRPMPEGSPGASFGSQKPCVTLPSKREAKRGAIPCNVGFPFG
jgi:hypothetical protein